MKLDPGPACGHEIADTCHVCWEWWEFVDLAAKATELERVLLWMLYEAAHCRGIEMALGTRATTDEWVSWCSLVADYGEIITEASLL